MKVVAISTPVPQHPMRSLLTVALALFSLVACDDVAAPAATSEDVSGRYLMMGAEGHPLPLDAPDASQGGEITLTLDGIAVRRVFFSVHPDPRVEEYGIGTYRTDGNVLDLRLRDVYQDEHVWTPGATLEAGVITLRYPNPADGPDIVETYVHTRNILYQQVRSEPG